LWGYKYRVKHFVYIRRFTEGRGRWRASHHVHNALGFTSGAFNCKATRKASKLFSCTLAMPTGRGTLLHQVCRRGLARAMQLLIAAGADVTAVGADGRTALCWAAARRDTGIVRVLLLAGADTAVLGDAFQRAVLQQWQRDLISLRVRCGRAR